MEGSMTAGDGGTLSSKRGANPHQGNAPRFDVRTHLYRMTGVDLTAIDGVEAYTSLKVVSEIGTDMSRWPTAKRFASWLGLSPNNRVSGGRVMSSRTNPSANRAAAALRLGCQCVASVGQRVGGVPSQEEGSVGGSEGDNSNGAQVGADHILDAEVRSEVRGCGCRVL